MEMERMECDKVDGNGIDKNQINIKMRAPTKILHFCDGTMEVFDDELTVEKKEVSKDEADTTVDEVIIYYLIAQLTISCICI